MRTRLYGSLTVRVPAAFGALGETAVELLHSFVPVSTGDLEQTSVPIVQRPRTWPFQGQNTGSNPVGDAIKGGVTDQACNHRPVVVFPSN